MDFRNFEVAVHFAVILQRVGRLRERATTNAKYVIFFATTYQSLISRGKIAEAKQDLVSVIEGHIIE
jgi:hypothetical protein